MIWMSDDGGMTYRASMGPRSFERGNAISRTELALYVLASMGPRSFEREIVLETHAHSGIGDASMGPRSFERGNLRICVLPMRSM